MFLLKWRLHGGNWRDGHSRASTSCPMPPIVRPPFGGEAQAYAIEKAAATLLTRNIRAPFHLTLLNLGNALTFSRNGYSRWEPTISGRP